MEKEETDKYPKKTVLLHHVVEAYITPPWPLDHRNSRRSSETSSHAHPGPPLDIDMSFQAQLQ